jgi:hypothetical protein
VAEGGEGYAGREASRACAGGREIGRRHGTEQAGGAGPASPAQPLRDRRCPLDPGGRIRRRRRRPSEQPRRSRQQLHVLPHGGVPPPAGVGAGAGRRPPAGGPGGVLGLAAQRPVRAAADPVLRSALFQNALFIYKKTDK